MTTTQNQKLLKIHQRRLEILKQQHAALGISAPAHLLMEIQDIEDKIEALGSTVENYNPKFTPPKPTRVGTCPQCKGPIKLAPKGHSDESPFKIYSIRVGTDIECGHCGTVIPDQFLEDEINEPVVKPAINTQSTTTSSNTPPQVKEPVESAQPVASSKSAALPTETAIEPVEVVDESSSESPSKKTFLTKLKNIFREKKET